MVNLVRQVEETLRARALVQDGDSFLVAVSGGLDSMVLLRVLWQLAPAHGWRLAVAHFNHQLRGRSSDADERLVRATARTLGLRFVAGRGDVKRLSERHGLSVEMAARQARHAFLARTARRLRAGAIALGHHADDQVELFFLRLLRGTGLDGLAGMKWCSPSPADARLRLVRPLLGSARQELEQFARAERVRFREDATNTSLRIPRNRVRRELLPLLRCRYQSALARTILRLMDIIEAEAKFVAAAARAWERKKKRPPFARWPVALQRRSVQAQLTRLGAGAADFELIETLRQNPDLRVAVNPRLVVSRDRKGTLHLHEIVTSRFGTRRRRLHLTKERGQGGFDGVNVGWHRRPQRGTRRPKPSPGCEWFDADKVGSPVVLRHWSRGDRFQPIGMKASVKLQDWFTNLRVPRAERHQLLVATTASGEVFWVEGQRIGERFKLDKHTVRRLKWTWTRGLWPVAGRPQR